jgi:5-bromo-4-chloroindolyl phosphate hydrolysis protein
VMSLCALAIVLKYMKDSKVCHARDMLNGTGLVLVIFSTVLVIIIADVEIQLTAAMGVLGGIAGYLFGTLRSSQPASNGKKMAEPAVEKKS